MPQTPGMIAAAEAVANASPVILAAAKALVGQEHIPWDQIDAQQQYTFCADAAAAISAADTARYEQDLATRQERTAHWGVCDACHTGIIIYPTTDREDDLPDEQDWADGLFYIDCPVCDDSITWGGTDHPADLLKSY